MSADIFDGQRRLLDSPATSALNVIEDDDTELTYFSRGVYVGGAGNLVVIMMDGMTAAFNNVPAGTLLPIRISKILETSTASDITVVW